MIAAVARAATSHTAEIPKSLDDNARHRAFALVAQEEPSMRMKALHDWPADPWSEDDHFHHLEHQRAEAVAHQLRTSESEVLRSVDDGMHGHWLSIPMQPTVPPCRPRPITD